MTWLQGADRFSTYLPVGDQYLNYVTGVITVAAYTLNGTKTLIFEISKHSWCRTGGYARDTLQLKTSNFTRV